MNVHNQGQPAKAGDGAVELRINTGAKALALGDAVI
jgi:hypothetical protein